MTTGLFQHSITFYVPTIKERTMNPHTTSDYAKAILVGLNNKTSVFEGRIALTKNGRLHPTLASQRNHIFEGVLDDHPKVGRRLSASKLARRRAAAKAARRSRKANRK
jgi:hypothetical protein